MTDERESDDVGTDQGGVAADGGTVGESAHLVVDGGFPTGRVRQSFAVGRREYRVLSRARWPVGLALAFAVFAVAVVWLSGSQAGPGSAAAVLVTLAELSVYVVPLAAMALGYDAVAGAGERGTLELLLSLPLSRGFVAGGLFVGRAAALSVGLALGLGLGGLAFASAFGAAVLPAYLNYLLIAVVVAVATLSVAVCLSALAAEKARALAACLVAWVWFVFVHDFLALGAVVALDPPSWVLTALVVANPVDLLRVVVLSLVPASSGGINAVVATTTLPVWAVIAGLAVWTLAPVALAGWALGRRA
jgi:Cu-processing system permease protein